jgi:hypothetical protein
VLYKRGRVLDDRVDKTCGQHIICTYLMVTIMYVWDDDDCRISSCYCFIYNVETEWFGYTQQQHRH